MSFHMSSRTSAVVLAVLAVLSSIACTEPTATNPPGPATPLAPPVELPAVPAFPTLDKPGEVYLSPGGLYAFLGTSVSTRYVLYDDGTFAMQFVLPGKFYSLGGRYARTASLIDFFWDASTSVSPWSSTGTLTGDQLAVKYNVIMLAIDFEDGTYVRSPALP